MTAIADFSSFPILEEHANGLKNFVPAFVALYAVPTPDQQKQADHMFKENRHRCRF